MPRHQRAQKADHKQTANPRLFSSPQHLASLFEVDEGSTGCRVRRRRGVCTVRNWPGRRERRCCVVHRATQGSYRGWGRRRVRWPSSPALLYEIAYEMSLTLTLGEALDFGV